MLLSTGEELDCPPRLGTPRNYDRRTLGGEVGEIARRMGRPLMPWQQYVADVALEVDDDDELVYDEVDLAVPRRQGKTDLILPVGVWRCRVAVKRWGPQNVYYTAQSGMAARRKWKEDQVKRIDRSPWGPLGRTKPAVAGRFAEVRFDNNDPGIFWANDSTWRPAPPTETAGHGDDADLPLIDEAFAHVDDRVEQAYGPAMLTRQSAQLWAFSAAGTDRSVYWWRKVLRGRAMVEAGRFDSPICFLEWSVGDDEDPFDPETWWRRLPALGHTITEAKIQAELDKVRAGDVGEVEAFDADDAAGDVGMERFLRPYCGIWCRTPKIAESRQRVIPMAQWLHEENLYAGRAPVRAEVFGVGVSPDAGTAAVGFGASVDGGRCHLGVLDHRPGAGVGWVRDVVAEIRSKAPSASVCINPRTSAAQLIADLERDGVELVKMSALDNAAACGALKTAVVEHTVRYRRQSALETAVDVAAKRDLHGGWAWDASASLGDIAPLEAVTAAFHAWRSVKRVGRTSLW